MRIVNFEKPFYLISDTHLFHKNIIEYCGRHFSSVEEMNTTIFNNWNNTIGEDEFVWFLGDFVCGVKNKYDVAQTIYDSLNGKKLFIKGNHDRQLKKYTKIPVIEEGEIGIIYKGFRLLLSHRPIWKFDRSNWDLAIHGHVHNSLPLHHRNNMFNVSVEMINYIPVHIDDVLKEFKDGCL